MELSAGGCMFTYDGMKRVGCFLQDNNVVVDGVLYEIRSTKNVTSQKSVGLLFAIAFGCLAVGGVVVGYSDYTNNDRSGVGILAVTCLLLLLLVLTFVKVYLDQRACRSLWQINRYFVVCVEPSDDPTTEIAFSDMPQKEALPSPMTTKTIITAVFIVLGVLLLYIGCLLLLFITEGSKYERFGFWTFVTMCVISGICRVSFEYQRRRWKSSCRRI